MEREAINVQAVAILKDPRILAAAVEANRRVLTPLWFELIEEGRRDGSIRTEYEKMLSELLPLVNFWLMPSVFPADSAQIRHKCGFLGEVLSAMGLPIVDGEMCERAERILGDGAEEVALPGGNAIAVISVLLVALSVLGAIETPTVQADYTHNKALRRKYSEIIAMDGGRIVEREGHSADCTEPWINEGLPEKTN